MSDRGSQWFRWALIAAVLVAVNCACDVMYTLGGKASCTGVDPARLRDVLDHDPQISFERTWSTDEGPGTYAWCRRGGIVACVDISPDVVRVDVSDSRPPSAKEASLWKERTDYICRRLSAACPELGAWTTWDYATSPTHPLDMVAQLVCGGVVVAGAWALIRRVRRTRRPPPPTETPS